MALTVKTAASERKLTTLSALKDTLALTDDSKDAFLSRLISAASDAIEKYVNHIFARQTYTETVRGQDHPILMLTNTPIISIASVLCEGEPVTDYVIDDAEIGTLYREVGWIRSAWIGWAIEPFVIQGTSTPLYTIEYQAGYLLPGEADATLPAAVEQACLITCADWFTKSAQGTGNIKSKKVGDLSIEYQDTAEGKFASVDVHAIPAAARSLLSVRMI